MPDTHTPAAQVLADLSPAVRREYAGKQWDRHRAEQYEEARARWREGKVE